MRRIEKYEDIKWDNDVSEPLLSGEVQSCLGKQPHHYAKNKVEIAPGVEVVKSDLSEGVSKRTTNAFAKYEYVLIRVGDASESLSTYEDVKWHDGVSEPLLASEVGRIFGANPAPYVAKSSRMMHMGRAYIVTRDKVSQDVRARSSLPKAVVYEYRLALISRVESDDMPWGSAKQMRKWYGIADVGSHYKASCRCEVNGILFSVERRKVDAADAVRGHVRYMYRLVRNGGAAITSAQPMPTELLPKVIARSKYDEDIRERDARIELLERRLETERKRVEALKGLVAANSKVTRIGPASSEMHPDIHAGIQSARRIERELQELAQEIVAGATGKTVEQLVMTVEKQRAMLDESKRQLGERLLEVTQKVSPLTSEELQREQALRMRNDGKSMLEICRLINAKHGTSYKPEHIKSMLEEVA